MRRSSSFARVVYVTRTVDSRTIDRALQAYVSLWTEESLGSFEQERSRWFRRPHVALALCRGEVVPAIAALAMGADYFALDAGARLSWNWSPAEGALVAAITRRAGRVTTLFAKHPRGCSAAEALAAGLCDALVPPAEDPLKWLRKWLGTRSVVALDAAASLVRTNRTEAGERIEFARLFSSGEPQRGLTHFLNKSPLDFSAEVTLETI